MTAVMLFEPDSDVVTGPLVPGAPPEPELDVDEIQGVVLPGFGTSLQHLLGLRFSDSAVARAWLRRWVDSVSTLAQVNEGRNRRRRALREGAPRPVDPLRTGIALSADGVRLFDRDPEEVPDPAYRVGLHARSGALGDPPAGQEGHHLTWRVGGTRESTPHVLVIVGGENGAELDERIVALRGGAGVTVVFEQRGEVLADDKEHFGFRDGVSQVGIRGRLSGQAQHFLTRRWIDPASEPALRWARPGQPLIWPGQFVFGYERQDRTDALAPLPALPTAGWLRNGSLLAFRRLRQDVPAFRRFCADTAEQLRTRAGFEDWTAARLEAAFVGRWPDGSALSRAPQGPDAAAMNDTFAANYFAFAKPTPPVLVSADPAAAREALGAAPPAELREVLGTAADRAGASCPRFAHVRKVNPRDLVTDQGGPEATLTLHVLRRGITWGRPYAPDEPAEASDRGLLFMCWQTSLEEQFERLTVKWMNRNQAPEGGGGHDLLVGQSTRRSCDVTGRNRERFRVETSERWVIPTGGGYFFGPSLSTLRTFAAAPDG